VSGTIWEIDRDALSLLETHGGPFGTDAFRKAVATTVPGWRDVSFGARTNEGTLAAVPLLARWRLADSVPPSGYGGVVASRMLDPDEVVLLLELACRELRLRGMRIRGLDLTDQAAIGSPLATASVIRIDPAVAPAERYSRLARRSIRRATTAGATAATNGSADTFWAIYAAAAAGRGMSYPELLVRRLIEDETARVHVVNLGESVVAVLLTLVTGSHWTCWLAAQTQEARSIAASYLAYDALLEEAHAAGITVVNLGASVGGGAEFKRHLGANEVPMREWTWLSPSGAAMVRARALFAHDPRHR
jgi:hypothetical protein